MQGSINILLSVLQTYAGLIVVLTGVVFTFFKIRKTFWEVKKIQMEVAELTIRLSSERNSDQPMQGIRSAAFNRADVLAFSLLILMVIVFFARLATTGTISRLDLIGSIWSSVLLSFCLIVKLLTMLTNNVTRLVWLLDSLVTTLSQESDSVKTVEARLVSNSLSKLPEK